MTPLFWVGVLAASGLVTAGIALGFALWGGSTVRLRSEVRALSNDVGDLIDRVEHWRGRDAVRRMRAGQAVAAEARLPQRGTAEYKTYLRGVARGSGNEQAPAG